MVKLTPAQQDIIKQMQHGGKLVKHKIHCGNPSYFVLEFNGSSDFADKRTVNSLIKRELVEFAEGERWYSNFKLTDAGRKVITV